MTPSRASVPTKSPPSPSGAAPLLRLHEARETIVAGVDGAAVAVRTLDGVSLGVLPGELLVVRGAPWDGTAALARAMAGDRRVRGEGRAGERELLPGTRVRRGAIGGRAAEALLRGWRAGSAPPARADATCDDGTSPTTARTVYLLRVRDDAECGPGHLDGALAWRAWAALVRREGSAVVLLMGQGAAAFPSAPGASAVREGAVSPGGGGDGVREVTLAGGRLVAADARRAGGA